MSLVLGWTDGNNAYIASDGRAGGTQNPSENYNKTRKINENIILGFVGYKEPSEHFLNCVYEGLGENINNCLLDDFLEPLQYGMNLKATKEKLCSTFLIIGKAKDDTLKYVIVGNSTNYSIKNLDPLQKRLYPIGGTIERSKILDICEKHAGIREKSIKETMRNIIYDVSDIDYSVNKNVFFQEIIRL